MLIILINLEMCVCVCECECKKETMKNIQDINYAMEKSTEKN